MSNYYPAIQAHLGSWRYYISRMTARQIWKEINFIDEDNDPDEGPSVLQHMRQRAMNAKRAKVDIPNYLARSDDRFFS